jgi:outer membrane protein assembly factor BamD
MNTTAWIFAAFLALTLFACSSEEIVEQYSAEKRFAIGMKKFNDEEYLDAIEDFKIVTLQFQGSKLADDAQYYMAECRFLRGEYILAAYEYDLLIRNMPTSEYVPRARFKKAMCYYNLSPESYRDQDYTRKAIDEFQAFIEYNPTDSLVSTAESKILELNTKLAKKDFESGMIYMKMEYFKAATLYFDMVLEKYHDTPYAEPAQLRKAEALYNRKRYAEAKQEIDKFLAKYPSSLLRQEAEKLKADITDKLSGPSVKPQIPTSNSAQNEQKRNGL